MNNILIIHTILEISNKENDKAKADFNGTTGKYMTENGKMVKKMEAVCGKAHKTFHMSANGITIQSMASEF
jgi:hypothetical protein